MKDEEVMDETKNILCACVSVEFFRIAFWRRERDRAGRETIRSILLGWFGFHLYFLWRKYEASSAVLTIVGSSREGRERGHDGRDFSILRKGKFW